MCQFDPIKSGQVPRWLQLGMNELKVTPGGHRSKTIGQRWVARSGPRWEIEVEVGWTITFNAVNNHNQCSHHQLSIYIVNIFVFSKKRSKSLSSSVESTPTINVINIFYYFERSSKSMQSFFFTSSKKVQNQCSQHFILFEKFQNQCRHQWRQNQVSM
jgi:hypothetical protein